MLLFQADTGYIFIICSLLFHEGSIIFEKLCNTAQNDEADEGLHL